MSDQDFQLTSGLKIARDAADEGVPVGISLGLGQFAPNRVGRCFDFNLGRDGGTGTINADNGSLILTSSVGESGMNVGRAASSSGLVAFIAFLVINLLVIVGCVRLVVRGLEPASKA